MTCIRFLEYLFRTNIISNPDSKAISDAKFNPIDSAFSLSPNCIFPQ